MTDACGKEHEGIVGRGTAPQPTSLTKAIDIHLDYATGCEGGLEFPEIGVLGAIGKSESYQSRSHAGVWQSMYFF